jgi:hypothetical protein
MNPLCNRLSLRQATRRVTQLCDQALAPLDLWATQLSMLREIDRLGPIALNPLAEAMVVDRATPNHNVRPRRQFGSAFGAAALVWPIAARPGPRRTCRGLAS